MLVRLLAQAGLATASHSRVLSGLAASTSAPSQHLLIPCWRSFSSSQHRSLGAWEQHSSSVQASILSQQSWHRGVSCSSSIASASSTSSSSSSDQSTAEAHAQLLGAPPLIISPTACRVVVIGWMGSRRRYLQKYSNLWLRSGDHEVLTLRPSISMTMLRWRGVVKAGTDIDRVARMHIENPGMPTIYHIFSMGGFIHAGTMWRWMDEVEDVVLRRDLLEDVKGIILDSAPCKVTEESASLAVTSALLGVSADTLQAGSSPGQSSLQKAAQGLFRWYLERPSIKLREKEVYEAWYEMAPACPQLYLYSSADPIVPAQDVERYMKIQESRGVEVSSYKWPDSGHCQHLKQHPQEYAFQVSRFLGTALADW